MNIWQTESYSFLLGTIFFVGLIVLSLFMAWLILNQSLKRVQDDKKWIYGSMSLFFLFCALSGIWAVAIEPYRVVVQNFSLQDTGLPNMKVVVVSDLHLRWGKGKKFVTEIVQTINEQNPDLVLMPGDFLTSQAEPYVSELSGLKNIKAPTYYVLGNHDYKINGRFVEERPKILRQALQQAELVELANEALPWSEKNIFIAGVEDNYLGLDDVESALKKIGSMPYILLAHSPDIVDNFTEVRSESAELKTRKRPNLIIAGHTHCGQIRLPLIGAIPGIIPTDHGREYDKHWYPEQNLFVTCGVGESGPAVRFMNPPEVVVLTIN